jgi:hypothetical protein
VPRVTRPFQQRHFRPHDGATRAEPRPDRCERGECIAQEGTRHRGCMGRGGGLRTAHGSQLMTAAVGSSRLGHGPARRRLRTVNRPAAWAAPLGHDAAGVSGAQASPSVGDADQGRILVRLGRHGATSDAYSVFFDRRCRCSTRTCHYGQVYGARIPYLSRGKRRSAFCPTRACTTCCVRGQRSSSAGRVQMKPAAMGAAH